MMPRKHTTFMLMDRAGFLLTESQPQELCSSINLFVESLVESPYLSLKVPSFSIDLDILAVLCSLDEINGDDRD